MRVTLRQLSKSFGPTRVVNSVSLEIRDGEMFFLLGPSGCGKTTVLRLVAGFYRPDDGEIRFDDRLVNDIPPNRRNTGMVFQNYALWPHLTVAENVAYGLEVRGVPSAEKQKRVREALDIVQMSPYADRSPTQLSGGQQQRVALARALVIRPDILLLDEPLSNLDAKLRLEMRDEIRRIHRETKLTSLYVTHDQEEALSLADRLAILNAGRVEQIGTPREVYRSPRNRFVAEFIGEMNFLPGTVEQSTTAGVSVRTPAGRLTGTAVAAVAPGRKAVCGFRPEAVRVGQGTENSLPATVENTTYLGAVEQFHLRLTDGTVVKARVANPDRAFPPGEKLTIGVAPSDLMVFPEPP